MSEGTIDDALTALVRVVEEIRMDLDETRAVFEELQIAVASGARLVPTVRVYPGWTTWVDEWLAVRISRNLKRYRWCHQYAQHPEVADRLEALWHAWETQWPVPEARLTWFRDGLDHHLAIISADDGPLRECSSSEAQHVASMSLSKS